MTRIRALYPRCVASYFIVSKLDNNSKVLANIPVREIADIAAEMTKKQKDALEVIIATPENVQPEIEETLENYGFRHYSRLDSKRWSELMKMFHIKLDRFVPLSVLPIGYNKPFMRVYMAKSEQDKPLINMLELPVYIYPLQVGADRAKVMIADRQDNIGDNISNKNGNYSELTGLYWIWKNKLCSEGTPDADIGQYYGLVQYRRMLIFQEDDLLRMQDNDVDAVLPYPMPYEPDIQVHHRRYLKDVDWNALLTALKKLQPEYYRYFPQVLEQQFLYNYNVIVAKKAVLRSYCEWLFPILKRTEELSVTQGKDREDRYIGYMAETLETLYFFKNADKLNVVHTECKLYV